MADYQAPVNNPEPKQVWEYHSFIDTVSGLEERVTDEEQRHLILGIAVVMGSRQAYEEEQASSGSYWNNRMISKMTEAGIIAERVRAYEQDPELLERDITAFEKEAEQREGRGSKDHKWDRIYGIIDTQLGTPQLDSREGLVKLGARINRGFPNGPGPQQYQKNFRRDINGKFDPNDIEHQIAYCNRAHDEEAKLKRDLTGHFKLDLN